MQSSTSKPIEIRRLTKPTNSGIPSDAEGIGLEISWDSGGKSTLSSESLRKQCPCASCKELRGTGSHQKPLSQGRGLLKVISATAAEETNLARIWPIGNYAIGLAWNDGHDTGIYTYGLLLEISANESSETPPSTVDQAPG